MRAGHQGALEGMVGVMIEIEPNRVGRLVGNAIDSLALRGATDREIRHLARKWERVSLRDLAKVEVACAERARQTAREEGDQA